MLKISDSIKGIINNQPLLSFGFYNKLFNLTKLASFLKPLVEVQTKKDVQLSAILMNLSRLQRQEAKTIKLEQKEKLIKNLSVHYDLAELTYPKNSETIQALGSFYSSQGKFFTISQGTREITIVMEKDLMEVVKKNITTTPINEKNDLACVGVFFDEKFVMSPGFILNILQQISLQNINIYEISSTYTELVFYLERVDIKKAFEALSSLRSI